MKERFIKRYKDTINNYFHYDGSGEGKRAIVYIMTEYENILQDEFKMTHDEIRSIYDELYKETYSTSNI